ncbi:MAG: hypothetical protein ACRELS_17270 [Candidatus Rokuibacteriota bacterium]
MATAPETRYAKSSDFHIAYQTVGSGPPDLVFVHGWISHIELWWEEPRVARFLERLASFSRLIVLDKRGTGLSDPVPLDRLPTLEERMDDVRAVMDAVGSQSAALMGTAGEVLVSSTVKDLVAGSGIRFDDRGTHVLRGVTGEWRLFAVGADLRDPHPQPQAG